MMGPVPGSACIRGAGNHTSAAHAHATVHVVLALCSHSSPLLILRGGDAGALLRRDRCRALDVPAGALHLARLPAAARHRFRWAWRWKSVRTFEPERHHARCQSKCPACPPFHLLQTRTRGSSVPAPRPAPRCAGGGRWRRSCGWHRWVGSCAPARWVGRCVHMLPCLMGPARGVPTATLAPTPAGTALGPAAPDVRPIRPVRPEQGHQRFCQLCHVELHMMMSDGACMQRFVAPSSGLLRTGAQCDLAKLKVQPFAVLNTHPMCNENL